MGESSSALKSVGCRYYFDIGYLAPLSYEGSGVAMTNAGDSDTEQVGHRLEGSIGVDVGVCGSRATHATFVACLI